MDTNQIILALTQQNIKLMDEIFQLKEELAKAKATQVEPIAPVLPKTKATRKSKTVDPDSPPKPKNPAHVETGKRLALWNANRKLIRESFKLWANNVKSEENQDS